MKFNLIINTTENWEASIEQALRLCQKIILQGHELGLVFFFGSSVKIISHSRLLHAWQQWHQEFHVKLILCSTMLDQHGLALNPSTNNHFQIAGLGVWVDAMEQADRIVELN